MSLRHLRLAATAATIIGGGLTALTITGTINPGEGSLAFPAAAIIGVLTLITHRPRKASK